MKEDLQKFLKKKASWIWHETLKINKAAPETRIASSMSIIEIIVTLFYGGLLRFFPKDPLCKERDRLIISKGHGSISMYPLLADLGYFDKNQLKNVCKKGGFLGGIPDPVIPGYETINGSLGHGLGVGAGISYALKNQQINRNVFVITGDGELHEGANWEAMMFASHHNLDNLFLIVDNNSISMLDHTDNIVSHGNLKKRIESFGWDCLEVDGHDIVNLYAAINKLLATKKPTPKALIANTIKGRGIPGIENQSLAHIMNPKPELIDSILDKNIGMP